MEIIKFKDLTKKLHISVYDINASGSKMAIIESARDNGYKFITFTEDGLIVEKDKHFEGDIKIEGLVDDGYVWALFYDPATSVDKILFGIYSTGVMAWNIIRELGQRIAFEDGEFVVEKVKLDELIVDMDNLYTGLEK